MKALLPLLSAVLLAISSSYGGTFTGGHGDIGIGYEEGQLHLHMHLGEEEPAIVNGVELSDEEFEPADVVIGISSAAQQVQSNAALAAGTGVPLGLPIWILPAEEAACLPFLGFGTEELTPEEWVGNLLLRLGRVTSPSGNGHFSIFTSDGAGGYVFLMSTADGGVTGADVLPLAAGGHEHFYLAFSESGTWQVELSAEGKHVIDGEVESDVESFAFEVGAGADPGVVTFQSAAYAVNEQASYRTVTVNRSAGSTGVLSVNYTTSDGAAIAGSDYTATSGTLVFGHGETEKGITVQIHNDTTVEPSETFSLRLTSQDATIGANSTATFTINDTPTVGAIAAQTTTIGTPTSAIPFTVADSETPAADLSVTALSSNPVLLPLSGIALGGSGASRTVTLTPVAELTGSSTVTLLVSDASGAVAIRTVTLSVGSTLAIPAAISDVVVTADESFTVNYTIANSSWVTVVTRSNTTLFNTPGTGTSSDLRTQPTSGGTSRTLRIRGSDQSTAAGVYGSSTVTLGFTGSGAPAAQTFNVRVNPRAVVDNNLLGIPGTTSTFDVLANDCIPLAGHTFTITGVSPPTHGTLEIAPGGSFLQYTPTDLTTGFDTFTYTVTVSSSDAFNGYQFSGTGYVKIGGYVVVDSPTASQHIDLDFNYVNGRWHQIIRTDAVVGGSQQSGTFSPTGLDADEGVLFFDPSTKQPRSAATSLDVLGVPAGADVWVGPSTSNGHKVYLGIANESTTGIESYTPAGDSRATSNSPWVATRLVGFSGPGHFAAFYNGVAFDTFDGLNSANDADAGGNVSDTFWGFGGSHAHLTWYFTAPGRYALTFQTTVKAGGEFVTSPPTTFYVDVDTVSGNLRLDDNPPQALPDALVVVEDGGAMSVDVIANDTSAPDGYEVLAVGAVTQGSHGATSLVGDGHSVSYTPAANFAGSDSFTYTVVDEHGGSATGTVNVTITPVNDMPTFVKGANPAHPSGTTGAQNIPNWATAITDGDADVDQALTFNVSVVSGGAIFSTPPSVSSGGSLNYVLGGTDGTAELEVTLTDDTTAGGAALTTASQSFSVTVLDQPPLISDLADASILENATLGPVSFTISDANHSAGSLNVAATSSNTSLVPNANIVLGGADGARTLTLTPAADQSGASTITVTVRSPSGLETSDTFILTVTPVNDMPSFVKGANTQHIDSASGLQTFPGWASAITDGDAEVAQTLTFQVDVVSGASVFTVAPAVSANGTLSYTLSGTPGIATIEVRLTDDATAGGEALTTAPQTFTVNAAPYNFTVVALGTLGGNTSSALDVNNHRQVTGNSLVTSDPGSTGSLLRAYLWTGGVMTNLGSMAPIPPSTSTNRFGRGYAVNDAGIVVGEFNNDSSRAFIYNDGVMSGLTRLAGGTDAGVALDINNSNIIVGVSSNGTASKPTKWTFNGSTYVPSDLGTVAGTATATGRAVAINDGGAVAGQSTNGSGTTQATLWNAGNIINLTSLGNGTQFSQALALNESLEVVGSSSTGQTVGQLIGTSSSTGITRAFSWKNGVMTELPPFNLYTPQNSGPTTNYHSVANDVNESGLVVGNSQRIAGSPAVATIWKDGAAIDLNSWLPPGSGWVLTNADGINDRGDITGTGTFGGASRAFLLQNASVNDMPSFVKGGDIEHFGSNSGAQSYPAWATAINDGDVEVEQALIFQINVVSGASIFAIAPAVSADGTLTYTLNGTPGVAILEIRLTDDLAAGGEALTTDAQTFTVASFSTTPRRIIAGVHADAIAIFEDDGALTLEAMADIDGESEVRLDPDEMIFNVEEATRTMVSSAPEYAFLGAAGSHVWIAPEQNPGAAILWPGISTEEVAAGAVDGDQVTLRLESVTGPGTLHIYQTEAGSPIRRLSSTGTDYRAWTLSTSDHLHANWAFSAAGTYALTFSAGALVDGVPVTAMQTYTFIVGNVPSGEATTTTLAVNPPITETGNPVTLTATVTPSNAVGYVEFLKGSTVVGQKTVGGGTASLTTSSLGIGTHELMARFVPAWAHDFAVSTSASVNATITESGSLPFSIVGINASYQPGQTLDAQVVGYTLQSGQQFVWQIRPAGSTSSTGATLQTSTAITYSQVLSASNDGEQIRVSVLQGGSVLAQTPWAPISVVQQGTRPVLTRTDGSGVTYPGYDIELVASALNLAGGETFQLVRRRADSPAQWATWTSTSTSPLQFPEPFRAIVGHNQSAISYYYAARVVSNGIAVRQSDAVLVERLDWQLNIQGLQSIYRHGATLNLTGTVNPQPTGSGWEYRWASSGILETDLDPQDIALSVPNLTVASWNGRPMVLQLIRSGTAVALSSSATIYVADSMEDQIFSFIPLGAHYHQGDNVNLQLGAEPAPLDGDQIIWEWKWPGGDWVLFPGASGLKRTLTAEQALHGVQVRATLDFGAEGIASKVAGPVTILVDDHGAAARQKPTIAGVTSYTAGDQVTLTRALPLNGPTILTTHLWERKGAGDSAFCPIAGETGAALSFPAQHVDDRAQYRVSILKPSGTVAYGPSPAVTLAVAQPASVIAFDRAVYSVDQGSSSVALTVTRTGGTAATSVTIATADGTASTVPPFKPAVAGVDYVNLTGGNAAIEFQENEMAKVVNITLLPDNSQSAPNKRFTATLSSAVGAALGLSQASVRILAASDASPTVKITSPAGVLDSGTWPYAVKGTAGAALGVDRVEVALNGGPAVAASLAASTTNASIPWSLEVEPQEGLNSVLATVYDLSGNSATVRRVFTFTRRYVMSVVRAVPAAVSSTPDLAGAVAMAATPSARAMALPRTVNANPQTSTIVPGTVVKLTATPKKGYVFSHWSGAPAGAVEVGNVLTFTMPVGDPAITAAFAENPFGVGGTFYGLLHPAAGTPTGNATEGYLTGTLTATNGNFSGKLLIDGITKSFAGSFYGNGSFVFAVGTAKQSNLSFGSKTLTLSYASGAVTTTVVDGDNTTTGTAKRGIYSSTNRVPAALLNSATSGFYTVGFPSKQQTPPMSEDQYPQGDGVGNFTVSYLGMVTVAGTLADGTVVTGSGALVAGDTLPLFVQLTTPGAATMVKGGCLSGELAFDPTQADSDVSGNDVLWIRPAVIAATTPAAKAAATNLYTDGWPTGIKVDAVGALYSKTLTVQSTLRAAAVAATEANVELMLVGGKLTAAVVKDNINITNSVVKKLPRTDTTYTLSVAQTTGAFSGTFTPNWPSASTAKPAFKGILIQKGDNKGGFGFFLSNALNDLDPESGAVTLGARP